MTDDTPAVAPAPPPSPARRHWRWLLPLGLLIAVLAGGGWLVGSEAGWRLTCRLVERLAGGQLTLVAPAGKLSDSFSLAQVHWRSETSDIQLSELRVDWRPAELLRGRLVVSRIAALKLRVANVDSGEPPVLPESLRLPLAVEVGEVLLERLEVGDHAHPEGEAATVAESLAGQLVSEGGLHRVPDLRVRIAGLSVIGEMALAAEKPFALTAKVGIEGEAAGRSLAFDLAADGPLEEFTLLGSARSLIAKADDRFAGELSARIAPFAPQPIVEALARLSGIDPAAWIPGAPQAELDLRAELRPRDDSTLGGKLLLVNHRPGAIDRQLLPVESLAAGLGLGEDEFRLRDLDLHLAGGGRLQGSGSLRDGTLALRLAATSLDASALYSSLRRTQLAGPLQATIGLNSQQLVIDLRDPRFSIQGKLAIDPVEVVVEALRLAADDAQLTASGKIGLVDSGQFDLRGSLQNFDPSRFADLPAARLNAGFKAQGRSRPQLAVDLDFQLRNSRLRGEALAGSGRIDLAGERLREANVELDIAGNRLSARGAFGAPGDRLTVSIAAPKLDPLGVAGDLRGEIVVSGSISSLQLAADVHSTRLSLPGLGQLRGLDLEAELGDGSQGTLAAKLRLTGLDRADGETVAEDLRLDAEGVRSRHSLRGRLTLAGKRELDLLLVGGLAAPAGGLIWTGTLSELILWSAGDRQKAFVRLAAPMPLSASVAKVSAGPGELIGAGWSTRLEQLRYAAGRWQTSGSLRALPVAAILAEFAPSSDAMSTGQETTLRVNGEWDIGNAGGADRSAQPVSRAALPSGRLRLWRESGDVALGKLALGLDEASVNLLAKSGRLAGEVRVRGQRFGEVDGEFSAASSADTLIDRLAPWRGQLRVNAPDVGWVGPLLGPGWQLGGRLAGEMSLGGTPAKPRLDGEWRGDALAVRALDQGMRLERGKLLLQLIGEADGDLRLVLRQLVFESLLQPMPRPLSLDPEVDVVGLTGRPGRLEASGELRTGSMGGVLTVKADRLGVTQRPDQWTLLSGDAQIEFGEQVLAIVGKFKLDAGYWELAKASTPRLSDDVVIRRTGSGPARPSASQRLLSVNLDVDLGRSFHFRGAGVESELVGAVNIRSQGSEMLRATGMIRTRGGRFDAYGQQLEIERGILNFQGLIDNPGLNIRAVRANLPVEAGVEVTGTARRPIVRLVSDPEVPDAEKLSWLVLGHGSDQQGGQESGMLLAAAQTILGGQDGGGGPLKAIQRGLGIDDFGIRSGTLDGSGRATTSRIASTTGFGASDTMTGQIVTVGKRLSSNILLSYDQSLTTAGSIVKLTVNLNRNFSLVGRAGSDTGIDLLWNYRFGR
jgi:translocation and assembly module TamB